VFAIEKWAQDKSVFLAIVAPYVAAMAREMPEALKSIKERRLYGTKFPLPPFHSWFTLYHTSEHAAVVVLSFLAEHSEFGNNLVTAGSAVEELHQFAKENPETKLSFSPEEMKEGFNFARDWLSSSFADLRAGFSGAPLDPKMKTEFVRFRFEREVELGFFCLVWAPCWLLFQMSPNRLYRKARRGDIKALERILNLDPLMLHDPTIGRELQKLRFRGNLRILRPGLHHTPENEKPGTWVQYRVQS
jgi:hypothetical protein